jgi:hypothetical protein
MSSSAGAGTHVTRARFLNLFVAVFLPMFMAAVDQTLLATATPAVALFAATVAALAAYTAYRIPRSTLWERETD